MKQRIISLLERAKENGTTIGDVLVEVRGMCPVCLTCDDHGAVGNTLDTVQCPDCASRPATPAAAERAPVADERAAFEAWASTQSDTWLIVGGLTWSPGTEDYASARTNAAFAAWQARAALASAPVAGEAQPTEIQSPRPSGVLAMDGASLHIKPDGSGQIIVAEDDFTLEDDRDEGPDGPQGSSHWVARLPASEVAALRDFLTGHARPSDGALWDQALIERDEYHDMADKLAHAIADHLLVEIGEHSSSNCPWMRALEAIENAAPQASPAADGRDAKDAERWRLVRRKLCLTGNGDGTCAMHALNLPASIPGWPEPGDAVAEFCDAAIDAAISAQQGEGGGV